MEVELLVNEVEDELVYEVDVLLVYYFYFFLLVF